MDRQMICFVALDDVLRISWGGMMEVAIPAEIEPQNLNNCS